VSTDLRQLWSLSCDEPFLVDIAVGVRQVQTARTTSGFIRLVISGKPGVEFHLLEELQSQPKSLGDRNLRSQTTRPAAAR
jgi:hypothetical protein